MSTTRPPPHTYQAPAVAAILTIGCLFLFTFVLPPPSPAFPSHVTPHHHEQPIKQYIQGVRSGSENDVELTVHVRDRLGERNATAKWLGGIMFEDIAQSGDGGIYAELIRNRAFQGSGIHMGQISNIPYSSIIASENSILPFGPVLDGWSAIGDVHINLDLLHPLSDALQVALQVDVPLNATGKVGIRNEGWWGIVVSPQTYETSFYAQADGVRFNWTLNEFEVSLDSAVEDKTWCSQKIPIQGRLQPYEYTYFNTSLKCDVQASNVNNTFAITFDGRKAAGQTIYFDLVSVFPETFKGRKNGLRKDLAENLAALRPKFLRFPGGNNLEGYSIQRRWMWWKTIGDLKDRPGRPGDWTYFNTDGLGLFEFLQWCEDMDMEPLLAVYAGFSLNIHNYDHLNSTGANEWPMRYMPQILKEALEELEYCMGSQETYWGKKRALHGHPEPFKIKMIEIGNEDFFSHDYPARAKFMYEGLKEHYPDITYIFSALNESAEFKVQIPPGGVWDAHVYASDGHFIENFDYWDHFQDKQGQSQVHGSLMEYHVSKVGINGVVNSHPRMGAAVAEAVNAIATERNPNAFKLSCFAPLLQNLNAYRGTPYDILFTSDPAETVLSASYYQQLLFNSFHGTHTLPVTEVNGGLNPLFWVALIDDEWHEVYVKIVNAGNTTQNLRISLNVPLAQNVNGTVLAPPDAGDLYAYNRAHEHGIVPKEIEGATTMALGGNQGGSVFEWTVPAFSIAVLQFNVLDLVVEVDEQVMASDDEL